MEQQRRRSVFITVVSIIAIAAAGSLILWSVVTSLMEYVLFEPYKVDGISSGGVFDAFEILAPAIGIAGVAFLISAIGMLKRKNVFRIAFVTLLGLANAGLFAWVLGIFIRLGFASHSVGKYFPGGSSSDVGMAMMSVVIVGMATPAIIVLIVFIMSKRASVDFRKPDEPDRPEEKQ